MKYIIIAFFFIILLLSGCTQPNDTYVEDKNDINTPVFIATCSDPNKTLVITQVEDGEIWDCV